MKDRNDNQLTEKERVLAIKAFEELGLCTQLAEAAASLGWKTPSVIQQQGIPPLLQGVLVYIAGGLSYDMSQSDLSSVPCMDRKARAAAAAAAKYAATTSLPQVPLRQKLSFHNTPAMPPNCPDFCCLTSSSSQQEHDLSSSMQGSMPFTWLAAR